MGTNDKTFECPDFLRENLGKPTQKRVVTMNTITVMKIHCAVVKLMTIN